MVMLVKRKKMKVFAVINSALNCMYAFFFSFLSVVNSTRVDSFFIGVLSNLPKRRNITCDSGALPSFAIPMCNEGTRTAFSPRNPLSSYVIRGEAKVQLSARTARCYYGIYYR